MAALATADELADLQATLSSLDLDNARLRSQLARSSASAAEAASSCDAPRARTAALRAMAGEGSSWLPEQTARRDALEASRASLQVELESHARTLAARRTAVAAQSAAVDDAVRQQESWSRALGEALSEAEAARVAMAAVTRAHAAGERALAETQSALSAARAIDVDRETAAGAAAHDAEHALEELRRGKVGLEADVRELARLRASAAGAARKLAVQDAANAVLVSAARESAARGARAAAEAAREGAEADAFAPVEAAARERLSVARGRRVRAAAACERALRSAADADGTVTAAREEREATLKELAAARRERDAAVREAGVSDGGAVGAEEAVTAALTAAAGARASELMADTARLQTELLRLREGMGPLRAARRAARAAASAAAHAYFTAVEALKLQALQRAALDLRLGEANGRMKAQQALYEAAKLDRAGVGKRVAEAQAEIGELRRRFRVARLAIDGLKDAITLKDQDLVKEHFEHHKVEKEKEGLRHDVTRLQKQVTAAGHIVAQQEGEVEKLNGIIADADAERARQAHALAAILSERNALQGALVERDAELGTMYESLRAQRSCLANRSAALAGARSERQALAARVSALRGAAAAASAGAVGLAALAAANAGLSRELSEERARARALADEHSTPLNVHRWRALADADPPRWAAILRVQVLQARLRELGSAGAQAEAQIEAREARREALRRACARQPTSAARAAAAQVSAALASAVGRLPHLIARVDAERAAVAEHKAELARALEATDALAVQYVRRQRAAQAQAARAAAPSKAQEVRSTSGGDEDRVAAAGLGAAHGWELEGDPGGRGASEELSAEEADAIKALADSLIAIGGE